MTKIYHFSGTGNSLWSAKEIARIITEKNPQEKCELFNIGAEAKKDNIVLEADTVIFVFPSYAYGLPVIVKRFAKKAVFKTQYFAAFVTFGTSPGGTLGAMRRIIKKKKLAKTYYGRIPATENYLATFGPQSDEKIKKRTAMQEVATKEAALAVIERRVNKVSCARIFSALISLLFSLGAKIFYSWYKISPDCDGCGSCAKTCPVGAIAMKDGKPVFTSMCENCQGCIDMCPKRALKFGRVKWGSPGYRNPNVSIADLTR